MKTTMILLVLFTCLAPHAVLALEVPLPGLVGAYPSESPVIVSVDFGQPILDVSRVQLRVEGTLSPSWFVVAGDTSAWYGELIATFVDDGPGWWMAPMETGGVTEVDEIGPYAQGTITSAALVYDGQVGDDAATWGAVQALFRP